MANDASTPTLGLMDKIKLFFTLQGAYNQISATPKSSFLTGEFWAKVSAAICTVWAGFHGFVPHPLDIYITVGLALWVSAERVYLKSQHMDMLVDLSAAPPFDPTQLTQVLGQMVAKFPSMAPVATVAQALADQVVAAQTSPAPTGNIVSGTGAPGVPTSSGASSVTVSTPITSS